MNRTIACLVIQLFGLALVAENSPASDAFFVTRRDTVFLQADSTRVVIAIADSAPDLFLDSLIAKLAGTLRAPALSPDSRIFRVVVDSTSTFEAARDSLLSYSRVKGVQPEFSIEGTESKLFPTDEVVIGFLPDVSADSVDSILRRHSLTASLRMAGNDYVFARCNIAGDPFQAAASIRQDSGVACAFPNFLIGGGSQNADAPTDPYFSGQYFLHNSGVWPCPLNRWSQVQTFRL